MKKQIKRTNNKNSCQNELTNNDAVALTTDGKIENRTTVSLASVITSSKLSNYTPDFITRRKQAVEKIVAKQGIRSGKSQQHNEWFEEVYDQANGDVASVPWANLQPKLELIAWLNENPCDQRSVAEIGCGLGDNAEAFSSFGWDVTAFDISESAIEWSKQRFPETKVQFCHEDLLNLPKEWLQSFDLVFDCFNLQAFLPGNLRTRAIKAMASLVQDNGELLLISLLKETTSIDSGPPWPLTIKDLFEFNKHGLAITSVRTKLDYHNDIIVPQVTAVFSRTMLV